MKVLLETSQPITNLEVYHIILNELKVTEEAEKEAPVDAATLTKDEIRYRTSLAQVVNYLADSRVTEWQSEEACSQCLDVLAETFDLRQFDLLQIVNMVPRSMPELLQCIEKPELRYDEEQLESMLQTIAPFITPAEE